MCPTPVGAESGVKSASAISENIKRQRRMTVTIDHCYENKRSGRGINRLSAAAAWQ